MNKGGFISIVILPFILFFALGFFGFSLLGLGIKTITSIESLCIKTSFDMQRELKKYLNQILKLNKASRALHFKQQKLQTALKVSLATLRISLAIKLQKLIKAVQLKQKVLKARQKSLLLLSYKARLRHFLNFQLQLKKLPYVKEVGKKQLFPKALAVNKKQLSRYADIYELDSNFEKNQANFFYWKVEPFFFLNNYVRFILNPRRLISKKACSATLKQYSNNFKTHLVYQK